MAAGHMNWLRIGRRDRMRRQGVEDIKGKTPLVVDQPPKQPRRKLSKAELREQAEEHSLLGAKARQPKTSSASVSQSLRDKRPDNCLIKAHVKVPTPPGVLALAAPTVLI